MGPGLMFAGKPRSVPSRGALTIAPNGRLSWETFPGRNPLAYFVSSQLIKN